MMTAGVIAEGISSRAKCDTALPPLVGSATGRTSLRGWIRAAGRSAGFVAVLALAAADYARLWRLRAGERALATRARWLHRWSRVVLRLIGLELHHHGAPPTSGMIVSNHLSYLDILAYSALVPCVFVAKREVASWPVLGLFARMAATIFVDRTRRLEVANTNQRIAEALKVDAVVVLFAEGTSSDGRTVLPFRPSLLEPATGCDSTIVPAAIRYHLDEGSVVDEVCYWRDMTLLPHLVNLFTKRRVRAGIRFGSAEAGAMHRERKEASRLLHERVSELRAATWDCRGHQSRLADGGPSAE